jgi:hypothetical protein
MSGYVLTPVAKVDIFVIWSYVADDSEEAADRVEQAIYEACALLAEAPGRAHPPGPHQPLSSFLDVDPLSQLLCRLPAKDNPASGCCSSPRKKKCTAYPEIPELIMLRKGSFSPHKILEQTCL